MKNHLQDLLRSALEKTLADAGASLAAPVIQVDATRDSKLGDFASNLAMMLAKPLGKPPRVVAEALVKNLPPSPRVTKVEIAGPGFINFYLAADSFQAVVPGILSAGEKFGRDDSGAKGKILVEFVSANPTGPMHVGHGRGAAYGDALSNILAAAGWQVLREYYINDAGRQVDVLVVSVWLRYLELCGETVAFPSRGYPADYIRVTAEKLKAVQGTKLRRAASEVSAGLTPDAAIPENVGEAQKEAIKTQQEAHLDALIARAKSLLGVDYAAVQTLALQDQLADIRATLDAFGVRFDLWYSEKTLVESGAAAHALEKLKASGHVYEKDGALWLATEKLGDEKDRVLIKADGSATYLANDLAYHVDKLSRAPKLLDVWGADHHGYIARMRAAIEAQTGRKDALSVQLIQFVTLSSGRMGKRSGNFVTLKELIAETGRDAVRFFFLMRSHDQHLEFDIELARSQTNENPVYYVQYACARIASVFRQATERNLAYDEKLGLAELARLSEPQEKHLLTALGRYAETLRIAAAQYTPHTLVFYLRDVADALHGYYHAQAFLVDDAALRSARLALVKATGVVLKNGLGLLGVSAPDRM
ncbi:MAG: arginine--tRNA ligase [Pseudomonadota bacterium]